MKLIRRKTNPSSKLNPEKENRPLLREQNRQPRNPYDEIKKLFMEMIEDAESRAVRGDDDSIFYARSEAISRFYNSLEDFKKYIRENHRQELWAKGEYYPRKWMLKDPRIRSVLERGRLLDILNFLDKSNLDRKAKETIKLSKGQTMPRFIESGKHEGEMIEAEYSFILVNAEFYEAVKKELGISKIYMQKHIQKLCKIGVLKKVMKTGPDGKEWLYADGYYVDWNGRPVKKRFLKNNRRVRDGLRNFRLP